MLDRGLTFLFFGRMNQGGEFHCNSSLITRFWGPGSRGQARGLVLQAPPPGLAFSRRDTT